MTILVVEPWDWGQRRLNGVVETETADNKIIVRCSKRITGNKFRSHLIQLSPRYEGDNFVSLSKNKTVTVGGALIRERTGELDYVFIGTVKIGLV